MKNAITRSLIVATITILLVSCEPDRSPQPAKMISIYNVIVNHKSDSIFIKRYFERYYGGLISFTYDYKLAAGEKITLGIDNIYAYQAASYDNTYYITDKHGKTDTIHRSIYLSEKEYHPKISETIVITD